MQLDTDRNLLFGVLAMQCDLIDASKFAEACTGWSGRKSAPLADIVVERGWITAEERAHIEFLLERRLLQFGGDAHKSLAAVADTSLGRALSSVKDAEIQHSIAELPSTKGEGHILLSTIAYRPEKRERYTLTRLHAKGGIGQVWLARDSSLGRDVALKELRPEQVENDAVWSRFLEEARITGQLEHPGIVPIYELSQRPEDKKPFYTMRFVRGRTLSEAIAQYHRKRAEGKSDSIDLHTLLQSFLGVCNAIAYAHSRGVIHRDLKGHNVILGDFGETLVLDWGLAKLVDQPESIIGRAPVARNDESDIAATLQGQALGTPGYMAPEQAEGRNQSIDRRTDVYGLGAILYEILSGEPPFRGEDTADLLRRVVNEEPRPPRQLNTDAPAPLQSICLKAIAKKPDERYRRVEDLAGDVQRYLADEPVSVHREPILMRMTRWGRRHRTVAASIAVLLVTCLAALSIGTILINGERAKAEASFRKARQAVDEYFTKVSESTLLNVPGLQPLRKELLESARKYYQEFLKERGEDPMVRADAAEASYRVGFVTMTIGTKEEALRDFERAAAMYESLARDHGNEPRYPYKLAMSLNDLGNQQAALGRAADAAKSHARALEIRERVARDYPTVAEYQKELAIGYSNQANRLLDKGDIESARRSEEKAISIYEQLSRQQPDVADYRSRLAGSYDAMGLYQHQAGLVTEALAWHDRAAELQIALVQEHPENQAFSAQLAGTYADLGFIQYRLLEQPTAALQSYSKARPILESLVRENPSVLYYHEQLGYCHDHTGRVLSMLDRPDDALASHDAARDIREELVRDHPTIPWYQNALAYTYFYIGKLHHAAGRKRDAVGSFEKARALWKALAESDAFDPYNRACILSLCGELTGIDKEELTPEDRATRERYGERAVETLRSATAGGFHNGDMIDKESDFDSIRTRPDYQGLMRGLRKTAR